MVGAVLDDFRAFQTDLRQR